MPEKTTKAPVRRRRLQPMKLMSLHLPVPLIARLDAASEKYSIARGTLARMAVANGLRGVTDKLRREMRPQAGPGDARKPSS